MRVDVRGKRRERNVDRFVGAEAAYGGAVAGFAGFIDAFERLVGVTPLQLSWRRGIPVAELARRVGVDGKRLWRVLNGERAMRADEFVRLCAELEVGLGRFLPARD